MNLCRKHSGILFGFVQRNIIAIMDIPSVVQTAVSMVNSFKIWVTVSILVVMFSFKCALFAAPAPVPPGE